jgi:hypothetical protein
VEPARAHSVLGHFRGIRGFVPTGGAEDIPGRRCIWVRSMRQRKGRRSTESIRDAECRGEPGSRSELATPVRKASWAGRSTRDVEAIEPVTDAC